MIKYSHMTDRMNIICMPTQRLNNFTTFYPHNINIIISAAYIKRFILFIISHTIQITFLQFILITGYCHPPRCFTFFRSLDHLPIVPINKPFCTYYKEIVGRYETVDLNIVFDCKYIFRTSFLRRSIRIRFYNLR